jgi:DNA-binding CsgD family transcriptional regulator
MGGAIVGRELELAAIQEFLSPARPGLSALVLEGEPGIGKSTVWLEALELAVAEGLEVLPCRPVQAEAKLALASLSDLLAPLVDTLLPELPEPQRLTLEVALLRTVPTGSPPDGRAVATATQSLLRRRTVDTTILVAIDDVQWLDRSSAAAISFALRRLADAPVRVLLALRVDGRALADPLELSRNLPDRTERLRLGPLSLGGLHHLLRDRLGQVLPRPMLQRIAQASGGNPLLALELARALLELETRPGPGEPLPVPETLADLLNARLRRLPSATRDALLAAAALSSPDTALIADALGEETAADLAIAEQAGVVHLRGGMIRFDHPLLASTLYSAVSQAKRRTVHRRLADAVRESEERARHLALAADGQDESVARLLEDAAEHARSRGAPSAAAELMELSLQLTPDAVGVPRRTVSLANLLNVAGDVARSEAVLEEAIPQLQPGLLRAEAVLLYGVIVSAPEDHAKSIEWCVEALGEAEEDPLLHARMHVYLAQSFGDLDQQEAVVHARKAVELLEPVDHDMTYANALQALAHAELLAGFPPNEGAIAEAMAIEERELRGRFGADLMFMPAYWASHWDDFDTACARLSGYLELAGEAGDEAVRPYLLGHLAETECQAGRYEEAAEHAAESIALAEQIGQGPNACAMAVYTDALLAALRGDLDEAKAFADRLDATFLRPEERGRVYTFTALGFVALSRGDLAGADGWLTRADALLSAIGIREPVKNRFQGDHVEAVVGLGDLDRAEALVIRLEERATIFPRPWTLAVGSRSRALLEGTRGNLDAADEAFRAALVHHERLPMRFELGRTRLLFGQLLRRRNERRAARDELESALGIFSELGTRIWAERAEEELKRIPIRRKASEGLTPTELQVAKLAAEGRTNREVANALFMSPKTVEANLSRAYRKLGIRSRAELGATMAELGKTEAAAKP